MSYKHIAGIIASLMMLAACSSDATVETTTADEAASIDALHSSIKQVKQIVDSTAAPTSSSDSLCYYLGFCEGLTYSGKLTKLPEHIRQDMNPDDYLAGVLTVLAADSLTNSFADGIRHGLVAARQLATMEKQGIRINRRIFAATITSMLDNPALDSIAKMEADSIAGMLINRQLKK